MLQLVVSFDITGSMASVLALVNRNLKQLIKNLPEDTEVVFIAHGNHSDRNPLFSSGGFKPIRELESFVSNKEFVSGQFGGYSKGYKGRSCSAMYEQAMLQANNLNWSPMAQKAMVVIGDEEPSNLSFGVDWKEELKKLTDKNVSVYGVHCLGCSGTAYFYNAISTGTENTKLNLDQFSDITEILLAIACKQTGSSIEDFAAELQARSKLTRSLANAIDVLSGKKIGDKLNLNFSTSSKTFGELVPVDPYRFQVMDVLEDQDISSFVRETGARFKKGAGFYELTKSEKIQENKEVVLKHKISGDMFSGEKAREMLGVPFGVRSTVRPPSYGELADYDVFIQSTSVNRKLTKGTRFLYEVDLT